MQQKIWKRAKNLAVILRHREAVTYFVKRVSGHLIMEIDLQHTSFKANVSQILPNRFT